MDSPLIIQRMGESKKTPILLLNLLNPVRGFFSANKEKEKQHENLNEERKFGSCNEKCFRLGGNLNQEIQRHFRRDAFKRCYQ